MDWAASNHQPAKRDLPSPPRIATLFRVVGPSKRPIRCASYQTLFGVELRLEFESPVDSIIKTELFKAAPGRDEAIADRAVEWRAAFDAVGSFRELPVEGVEQ